MNWYIQALLKYTEFIGRARRSEYWHFALFNLFIFLFIILLDTTPEYYGFLGAIYSLAIIIPGFAITIKRNVIPLC